MTLVLAVDGGNSKTDVALVDGDGRLLAAVRGETTSHQQVGGDAGMQRLSALVAKAYTTAGVRGADRAEVGVYCLAGADTPSDIRELTGRLSAGGFARTDLLRNDTFAALRAGTDRGWGVVVICGQGVNAAGVAPDGRTARLEALGDISGDWGGATDVGWQGLAAAVRARDGRGPTDGAGADRARAFRARHATGIDDGDVPRPGLTTAHRRAVSGRVRSGDGWGRGGARDRRPTRR